MEFSSLLFLFSFLPIFLVVFFALKQEAHNSFILIASLCFYAWGEGSFVLLLLVSVVVNYGLGLWVDCLESSALKKPVFILAVLFNLGLLIYFKYTSFILDNLGIENTVRIHLPMGISFFTFQALSYIVDIYRRTVAMDRNPLNFAVYMTMFPKLITGPITPYHNLKKQIGAKRGFDSAGFALGLRRFVMGLGKKILIADTLAVPANQIFALAPADLTTGLAWTGIVCYSLQIYFDFSGYTDMAIGIGKMCGFEFIENFNYPYIARSIKDFWKRWHISLAHWLRDYLFLPIAFAVSRRIKDPKLMGIKAENWAYFIGAFITFFLCGVWHGANWTFFVWGAYYGILLSLEHGWYGRKMKRKWPKWLQLTYCQVLVMIGWVFFRSPDLGHALGYLKAMFNLGSGSGAYYPSLYLTNEVILFLIIGCIGAVPFGPWLNGWLQKRMTGTGTANATANWTTRMIQGGYIVMMNLYHVALLLACTVAMAAGTYNPFIYARF